MIYEAIEESKAEVSQWMDWCHPNYRLADVHVWIEMTAAGHENGSQFEFGIFGSGRRFLGGIGLNHINTQAKYANLGYWVRSSATGLGIASSAVCLLADWAFRNTDLNRLEIVSAVENPRSQAVAEKAGAIREGVLRSKIRVFDQYFDGVMYSIVRGDVSQ